MTYLQQAGQWN